MKPLFFFFLLVLLNGCKKEAPTLSQEMNSPTVIAPQAKPSTETETDTIFFSYEKTAKWKDYVLVHLLNRTFDKDSICTARFKLNFMTEQSLVASHDLEIKGYDIGSGWSGNFELDSVASPLKRIHLGYPACGYIQSNFLFYTAAKKIDLVYQWDSMSDSGWGSWGEVVSGTPQNFYFRKQSYSPDDNDEDMGINEFSDSTHFELKNNRWVKTIITPEGKAYRSKKISFDDFHKS
ncbi:hypothetical protein [Flavobacterium pedocola]